MRLKKGFTLAEILIVLMVIGVIATMTIPSMMKGVAEAQIKAGYKKAYNAIVNFAAMEKISGTLPILATNAGVNALYTGLNNSLSVKEYAVDPANSSAVPTNFTKICLQVGEAYLGTGKDGCAKVSASNGDSETLVKSVGDAEGAEGGQNGASWITTDDGISYAVFLGGAKEKQALTKQEINAQTTEALAYTNSSAIIVVDVNGIGKGPNTFEKQGYYTESLVTKDNALDTITGDRFKIYIGSDGATAGPKDSTVTGRMVADAK